MAINPYMVDPQIKERDRGDMIKIRSVYRYGCAEGPNDRMRTSLSHPYKTEEDVRVALQKSPSNPHDALAKIHPSLRKDQEAMLSLIRTTADAYLYTSKSIRTEEFNQKALRANPSVYGRLSNEDRQLQSISDAYRDGMLANMRRYPLDNTTMSMQFKNQFSKNTNINQVFSPEVYERAYESIVVNTPLKKDGRTLNEDAAVVFTARMLNSGAAKDFDDIDKKVWERHPERVIALSSADRRYVDVDLALTAIETICPQYKPLIAEVQKDFWQRRVDELIPLREKRDNDRRLSRDEIGILEEAERHVDLDVSRQVEQNPPQLDLIKDSELKEQLLRIESARQELNTKQEAKNEKEREENLAYLIQDSKTRVLSAAGNGEIDEHMAANILGYLNTMQIVSTSNRAQSIIANAEAYENNIDNVDYDLAYSDPTLSEDPTIAQRLETRDDGEFEMSSEYNPDHGSEYDPDQDYEEHYAGNPFVSYVDPNGMEPIYNPDAK